jgi:hypothetical protein
MEGFGYIGQAGTGKTTELIKSVEESIDYETWSKSSALLALTFMHGSRRRLEAKLSNIQRNIVRVCCQTIDSFCLTLFQRYRSFLGITLTIVINDNPDDEFEDDGKLYVGIYKVREYAVKILDFEVIKNIISFSYPIIVVDEFQDCDGALLDVIKRLSDCTTLYVAADNFQKLDNSPDCLATDWLSESFELTELEKFWRTDESKILDSASSMRTNEATKNGVELRFAPTKDLAAYFILSNMQWYDRMGGNNRSVAIISPVSPRSDAFVRQTLERINQPMSKPTTRKKKGYHLNPQYFTIEGEKRVTTNQILNKLEGWDTIDNVSKDTIEKWNLEGSKGYDMGVERAKKLMNLRNTKQISKNEFAGLVSSGIHFFSTYIMKQNSSRIFLTVHGAKNREFDDVFILWSKYTLPKEELYQRKLLYNAITRAKRKVLIIAEGQPDRATENPLNLISG